MGGMDSHIAVSGRRVIDPTPDEQAKHDRLMEWIRAGGIAEELAADRTPPPA